MKELLNKGCLTAGETLQVLKTFGLSGARKYNTFISDRFIDVEYQHEEPIDASYRRLVANKLAMDLAAQQESKIAT